MGPHGANSPGKSPLLNVLGNTFSFALTFLLNVFMGLKMLFMKIGMSFHSVMYADLDLSLCYQKFFGLTLFLCLLLTSSIFQHVIVKQLIKIEASTL